MQCYSNLILFKVFLKVLFFMGLLELFGKKPVAINSPYAIAVEFHPMRLQARKNDFVQLEADLQNISGEEYLTSLVIVVQKPLALDQSGLSNQRELRLGLLKPGEVKRLTINVYGTARTESGDYLVKIYAISHYRDYGHILN